MSSRVFFAGLTVIILGLLIFVYDYPQMIYIQTMTTEELRLFDRSELAKFERIQIEFYVGAAMIVLGSMMLFFSKFTLPYLAKK